MIATEEDFELKLLDLILDAENKGLEFVGIVSGDLHRLVGGYPADGEHRMPVCCQVMKNHE